MSNDWRNGGTLQYGVSVSYKRKEEQKWLSREFWGDNAVIDAKNYFDIIFDEAEEATPGDLFQNLEQPHL